MRQIYMPRIAVLIGTLFSILLILSPTPVSAQPSTGLGGFSDAVQFIPESGEIFVITHADRIWDEAKVSKAGITNAIERLKPRMPVVLLSESPDPKMHFVYRKVQFLLPSDSGEVRFSTTAKQIFLAGGFLGACLDRTKYFLLKDWSPDAQEFHLTFITDGIFGGRQFLGFFERDLNDFYRAELDRNSRLKVKTLADFFRLIDSGPDALRAKSRFIETWLKDYESNHQDLYEIQHQARVEVRVNGEQVFTREPSSPSDRILRIDFVRSDSL
jgi:hypothetical protein